MHKNIAVLGVQFGDEGKARVVNYFAKDYRYIIRFSGSANAGHTLYYQGQKIIRHLIPSADFSNPEQFAFLGSDMVINPDELLKEIQDNQKIFPTLGQQIIVDPDAFIITPEHLQEDKANMATIGSTGKGVSPAYRDKTYRKGVKFSELINNNAEVIKALAALGVDFKYSYELYGEFERSKLLFEGAQSILLDKDFGAYPYVTSGACGLNGIINSGFAKFLPEEVYGVAKCYATRVGNGPFPTELFGTKAEDLRKAGNEYGSTTGRPRRVGWIDLPALKYSCIKGGVTKLVLTKFDILSGLEHIPMCTSYDKNLTCGNDLNYITSNYFPSPGWQDASDINQLIWFIHTVQNITKVKIEYISYGPNPEDILKIL